MTPMIDVVFLLLIFFVLTFKIIVPEGDFNVQMAPLGQAQPIDIDTDSIRVRLIADADGALSAIQLNNDDVENLDILRQRIALTKPDLDVLLIFDDHLRYEYLISAITAVNGDSHEGQMRNVKFAKEPSKTPLED